MRTMTHDSVVNLFRYDPRNVLFGYHAVFETMRDHPAEAQTILARYGYTLDLAVAERRYALMQRRRPDGNALEDVLLTPKAAVPSA